MFRKGILIFIFLCLGIFLQRVQGQGEESLPVVPPAEPMEASKSKKYGSKSLKFSMSKSKSMMSKSMKSKSMKSKSMMSMKSMKGGMMMMGGFMKSMTSLKGMSGMKSMADPMMNMKFMTMGPPPGIKGHKVMKIMGSAAMMFNPQTLKMKGTPNNVGHANSSGAITTTTNSSNGNSSIGNIINTNNTIPHDMADATINKIETKSVDKIVEMEEEEDILDGGDELVENDDVLIG